MCVAAGVPAAPPERAARRRRRVPLTRPQGLCGRVHLPEALRGLGQRLLALQAVIHARPPGLRGLHGCVGPRGADNGAGSRQGLPSLNHGPSPDRCHLPRPGAPRPLPPRSKPPNIQTPGAFKLPRPSPCTPPAPCGLPGVPQRAMSATRRTSLTNRRRSSGSTTKLLGAVKLQSPLAGSDAGACPVGAAAPQPPPLPPAAAAAARALPLQPASIPLCTATVHRLAMQQRLRRLGADHAPEPVAAGGGPRRRHRARCRARRGRRPGPVQPAPHLQPQLRQVAGRLAVT